MLNARLTGLSDRSGKKGMPVLVVSAGSAGILNALGITGVNVFGLYPAGTAPISRSARSHRRMVSPKIRCAAAATAALRR
jgi:hypothetical protein